LNNKNKNLIYCHFFNMARQLLYNKHQQADAAIKKHRLKEVKQHNRCATAKRSGGCPITADDNANR
jgi:hypothetical protein